MPFLWLAVPDDAGPGSDRARIEAGVIALISRQSNAVADPPSPTWLGQCSHRDVIRKSGLWNIRHVGDHPDPDVLSVLEHYMDR